MAAGQGKRYSEEEKAEIVAFIKEFDKENNRGGLKAASEKFGVSTVSIARWTKGQKKGRRKARKTAAPRRVAVASPAPAAAPKPKSTTAALSRMVAIHEEIDSLQAEYEELKKSL